jgi:Acetyl-CoA dehydrogenase C-terminal like
VLSEVRAFAAKDGGNGRLKSERAALTQGADDVAAMVAALTGFLGQLGEQPSEIYRVGLNTTRLLLALGDLLVGWLLARQAEVALERLDELDLSSAAKDRDFYTGKVAAARFFAATVLPRLNADRRITEDTTLDLMDLPEAAF